MRKSPTNLSVDPVVMERGKLYGQRHGTSVSQMVGDFLSNLPLVDGTPEFTPTVSLLYGIAVRTSTDQLSRPEGKDTEDTIEAYHRHIEEKYGSAK